MVGPDIFISYRRDDDPAFAGRLHDSLKSAFPRHSLFIDVSAIRPGTAFLNHIIAQIKGYSVFLPIIGHRWSSANAATGVSRLFDTHDVVRIEVESAIACNCAIIPILVNDAQIPAPRLLPDSIAALSSYNATRLTHGRFHEDARILIQAIKGVIKHTIDRHLTVAEVEACEFGKSLHQELTDAISRAVEVSAKSVCGSMLEVFLPRVRAAISEKNTPKLYGEMEALSDAIANSKSNLTNGTIDYVSRELHPLISPYATNDELYSAIRLHIEGQVEMWFRGMQEAAGEFISKEMDRVGWRV